MDENKQDLLLQAPQEANTVKHLNFREAEEASANDTGDTKDDAGEEDSPTKKAWQELRGDLKKG